MPSKPGRFTCSVPRRVSAFAQTKAQVVSWARREAGRSRGGAKGRALRPRVSVDPSQCDSLQNLGAGNALAIEPDFKIRKLRHHALLGYFKQGEELGRLAWLGCGRMTRLSAECSSR